MVALYHYQEAERIVGPAVIGESVLLQVRGSVLDLIMLSAMIASCSKVLPFMVLLRYLHPLPSGPRGGAADLSVHLQNHHWLRLLDGERARAGPGQPGRQQQAGGLQRAPHHTECHSARKRIPPYLKRPALITSPCHFCPPLPLLTPPLMQIRFRDFKPMLSVRPGLTEAVKAKALQTLSDRMQRFPGVWQDKGLMVWVWGGGYGCVWGGGVEAEDGVVRGRAE